MIKVLLIALCAIAAFAAKPNIEAMDKAKQDPRLMW
jgi:hypothetical protein